MVIQSWIQRLELKDTVLDTQVVTRRYSAGYIRLEHGVTVLYTQGRSRRYSAGYIG